MRLFTRLCLSAFLLGFVQASPLQIFYPHLQIPYSSPSALPHALWLYPSFTRQSFEGKRLTSFLIQGGYDYSLSSTHTLGFGLQYGYSKLSQTPLQSLGILLQDRIFLGDLSLSSSLQYVSPLDAHLIFASLELAYKLKLPYGFYLAPALKGGLGYLSTNLPTLPYLIQAGSYVGVDFGSNGSLALGALYEREISSDDRLLLSLRASFRPSERFELFLQSQNSFFGRTELNYNIGLGLRFLWGSKTNVPDRKLQNGRSMQDVQREMLYQASLSRQRIQAKTYLRPDELKHRYETQDQRDTPFVQDELKSSNRQRYIRESSKWIDTKNLDTSYQNRNLPNLRSKDLDKIKEFNRRELERKYGK